MMRSQLLLILLLLSSSLLITLSDVSAFHSSWRSRRSSSRRNLYGQRQRQRQRQSSSPPLTTTTTTRRMSKDDVCGEGFIKQTGPDGEYCVFDYDTVSSKFGTDHEHQVPDPDHYWEGLEAKNMARKKFGLKPLSPEEYVALQVQSKQISDQVVIDAITVAFDKFDANSDGVITFQEFKDGLQKQKKRSGSNRNNDDNNISELTLRKVFDVMDTSGDGLLQLDEFVTLDKIRNKLERQQQEDIHNQQSTPMSSNMFQSFIKSLKETTSQFTTDQDRCESNFDCNHPEVCCDFGFTKRCCRSGKTINDMQLEYAMVPVPQGYSQH